MIGYGTEDGKVRGWIHVMIAMKATEALLLRIGGKADVKQVPFKEKETIELVSAVSGMGATEGGKNVHVGNMISASRNTHHA